MKERYVKINLMKYIPLDSYVTLNPKFRFKLYDKAIKKVGSGSELAKLINTNATSVFDWKFGKFRPPLGKVIKCIKLLGWSENELSKNIVDITSYMRAGMISINQWKLTLDEKLAEWFGLLKGDGSISQEYIEFANSEIEMTLFFAEVLNKYFNISKDRITMIINVPFNKTLQDAKEIIESLRKRGYTKFYLNKIVKNKRSKKFVIVARSTSKVLAQILRMVTKNLQEIIKNSPASVKAAYVRGFASAEGGIHRYGAIRMITISQKDRKELEFVNSLLDDLGVTVSGIRPSTRSFQIFISNQVGIRQFYKLIGFGTYSIKSKKLAQIIEDYEKLKCKLRPIRYEEILKSIKNNEGIAAKQLCKILGIGYRHMNLLLREMLKRKLIKVDSTSIPYKYYSSDDNAG